MPTDWLTVRGPDVPRQRSAAFEAVKEINRLDSRPALAGYIPCLVGLPQPAVCTVPGQFMTAWQRRLDADYWRGGARSPCPRLAVDYVIGSSV